MTTPPVRIGPQSINTTPNGLAWAQRASIVKGVDNVDMLRAAPNSAIRIFRHYFPQQDVTDAINTASQIISYLSGYRHPLLFCEIWVGEHPTPAQVQAVVTILHQASVKVCGPSWYSGDYTQEEWLSFRAAGWAHLDAIAVQGYWTRQYGFTEWNAFRHRTYYNSALDGGRMVFITECGEDTVRDGPDGRMVGEPGWKANSTTKEQYAQELVNFNNQLLPHERATPFAVGTNKDFFNFELEEVIPVMLPIVFPANSPPTPPPPPVRAVVGLGFRKCIQYIGNFTQDEQHNFPNTPDHTSLAIAVNGYATWRWKTNETHCFHDDGREWRDYGNKSTTSPLGQLVQVSDPFR